MKPTLFSILLITVVSSLWGQKTTALLVGTHSDIIKTDNTGFFEKMQTGLEVNYFISREIAITAGGEFWSPDQVSLVVGGRWYATEILFVRARGLIGQDDFSIGVGWHRPFLKNWRLEAIGDFYFNVDFAIRLGIAYGIGTRRE